MAIWIYQNICGHDSIKNFVPVALLIVLLNSCHPSPLGDKESRTAMGSLFLASLPLSKWPEDPEVPAPLASITEHLTLVSIKSPEEALTLSQIIHEHNGFCGSLQPARLSLNQTSDPPLKPIYHEAIAISGIQDLIKNVNDDQLADTISTLEQMGTRQHNTPQGLNAPSAIRTMFEKTESTLDADFALHDHRSPLTEQQSLVVRVSGVSDQSVVIVGAHLDSINRKDAAQAPGADDDATGIATLLETYRVFSSSDGHFQRSVEWHAYGAEEIGLIGSNSLAQSYRDNNIKVAAMLQIDMNGFSADTADSQIYLVTTDTNGVLRRSLALLLQSYLGGGYQERPLGAGTSDHKSWLNHGFPVVFPFENPEAFNRRLHTSTDSRVHLNNPGLTKRFAQMVIAFIAHYAGWSGGREEYQQKKAVFNRDFPEDLYIAASGRLEELQLGISASLGTKKVELCIAHGRTEQSCRNEPISLVMATEIGKRILFKGESIKTEPEDTLLLRGFDANDKIISERVVHLTKS